MLIVGPVGTCCAVGSDIRTIRHSTTRHAESDPTIPCHTLNAVHLLCIHSNHRVWIRSNELHLVMPGCMVDRARTPRTLGSSVITLSEVRFDSGTAERSQYTPMPSIAALHPYLRVASGSVMTV